MSAPDRLELRHADDDAAIRACFGLMQQLRPHLASADEMLARVRRQAADGYRLLAGWDGQVPVVLAGYRYVEMLVRGRFLYVDDLVATEATRGRGFGAQLLRTLADQARAKGLPVLVLDTGIDNPGAQRFYEREGMRVVARRYAMRLT